MDFALCRAPIFRAGAERTTRSAALKKYSAACIFLLHAGADLVFFKSELV